MKSNWLIYGAYGFTGELIARHAIEAGHAPILAGRNTRALEKLASELNLEYRAFDLSDQKTIEENLADCALVLHCAGPFQKTCRPMAQAAIASGCHYLDITGEISVYEYLYSKSERAEQAGVMLLPGVGFDVVPTDCMAGLLKEQLPDAKSLELAFIGPNKAASGSIKTALRQLPYGSMIRKDGQMKVIPQLSRKRKVRIEGNSYTLYAIPWGDVFTAYHSTGIPDIAVYTVFPESQALGLKLAQPLTGALKNPQVLKIAENLVERLVPDPGDEYFSSARCYIWGEAANPAGSKVSAVFETLDTYSLTIRTSLLCIEKILSGTVRPGFQTPSLLFGHDLIFEVEGTRRVL